MIKLNYKIKKRIRLILEGKTNLDKLRIVLWLLGIKSSLYLKNKEGIFFVRKNSADLWMLSSMGEEEVSKYLHLGKGVFLDIGANAGKYTVKLGKELGVNGKVLAFEPEPDNILALKRNLNLNEISNVKIFPIALSSKKGRIKLYLDKKNSGGHSILRKTENFIEIKTDTLDNILRGNNQSIKLIKIDVEGAESEVLKGAVKTLIKYHPKIIFEAWDENYLKKCLNILTPLNYKIRRISKENYYAI